MAQQGTRGAGVLGFLGRLARERRWWWVLFWVNGLGSLYGFWWYRYQLQKTPIWQWLIVPDSPGATLLFAGFLALLLARHGAEAPPGGAPVRLHGGASLLGALAFISNMKYGLWTAIVLPYSATWAGRWTFDDVHLSLSHAGMWVQGFLFLWYYRPSRPAAAAAFGWVLFQDWIDYIVLHTHSTLPYEELHSQAAAIALGLSLIWGTVLMLQAWRGVPARRERSRYDSR